MLRVVTKFTFIQQPTAAFPERKKTIQFDFCNGFESEDSWETLTNKAKIVLPKSIYVKDESGKRIQLDGLYGNLGGFAENTPMFLKGDKVKIEAGYRYFDRQKKDKETTSILFEGYVSKVNSRKPIELECEDEMWQLKQIQMPKGPFASNTSVNKILSIALKKTDILVNSEVDVFIGQIPISNETVCEFLSRIRKEFQVESHFRGKELRIGFNPYRSIEGEPKTFTFQENIISDNLEYKRKDDITLAAKGYSVIQTNKGGTTKDGQLKRNKKRMEVYVIYRNGRFEGKESTATSDPVLGSIDGEVRTFYFYNVPNKDELIKLTRTQLEKYFFDGMRGSFTTFGLPFVRQGDVVVLKDKILPERNGEYRVRSVKYSGGADLGLRQEIFLHYKIK